MQSAAGIPAGGWRIVFVEFSPSGGLFQFATQLGTALAERGHDVHLLTGPKPELASGHAGFEIHPVLPTWHPRDGAAGLRTPIRWARRVIRAGRLLGAWLVVVWELLRVRPDVVLWSTWRFTMDGVFVGLIARLLPRSTMGLISHEPVAHQRRDTNAAKSGRVFDRAIAAAWRSQDVVFVLGEQTRDQAVRVWQPAAPVLVIPHGDGGALVKGEPGSAERTGPTALFFGTWTRYKGIDLLLDAFAEVRVRVPEARLVLAGGVGADVDLAELLRRSEAVGAVDARPRYIDTDELNELFSGSRAVVLPYLRASQSGVAHLAQTFARPVVATRVGDVPDVVRDGETGIVVEPNDLQALAEALVGLLTDPSLAARLGDAGRRRLSGRASWPRVAERVEQGLRRVRGDRRAEDSEAPPTTS